MKKLILDKELSKDVLQGIGYYAFLAGLVRLCVPSVKAASFVAQLGFVLFLLWLIWFVSTYIMIHIVRPVVKLYHPEFTLPEVDPDHVYKSNWRQVLLTKSFAKLLVLYLASLYFGWLIVGIGMDS